MKQGEVRETDMPLTMRCEAGAVLGIMVLGLLGNKEIGSRSDEAPDVLTGLLRHELDATKRDGHVIEA